MRDAELGGDPHSVSQTLAERGATVDAVALNASTQGTFAAITAVADEEDSQ